MHIFSLTILVPDHAPVPAPLLFALALRWYPLGVLCVYLRGREVQPSLLCPQGIAVRYGDHTSHYLIQ